MHIALRLPDVTVETPHPFYIGLANGQHSEHKARNGPCKCRLKQKQECKCRQKLYGGGDGSGNRFGDCIGNHAHIFCNAVHGVTAVETLFSKPFALHQSGKECIPELVFKNNFGNVVQSGFHGREYYLQEQTYGHSGNVHTQIPGIFRGGNIHQLLAEPYKCE